MRLILLPALFVGVLGVALSLFDAGFAVEESSGLPWLFKLRGEVAPPRDLAIVRIDRDTVARLRDIDGNLALLPERLRTCGQRRGGFGELGQIVYERMPRTLYACLVDELRARGVRVIAFDIAFSRDAPGTDQLADAIRAHGSVVLLARAERRGALDVLIEPHPALRDAAAAIAPFSLPSGRDRLTQFWSCNPALAPPGGAAPGGYKPCRPGTDVPSQLPLAALQVQARPALAALAELARIDLAHPTGEREVLAWLDQYAGRLADPEDTAFSRIRSELDPGSAAELVAYLRALDGPPVHFLNPYGPPGAIASFSLLEVFGRGEEELPLAGRAIFVGIQELTQPEQLDAFRTVFARSDGVATSGVELAATSFANLRHGETLRAPPEWSRLLLVGLLGAGFTLAARATSPWRGLAYATIAAATYGLLALVLFVATRIWLPIAIPVVVLLPLAVITAEISRIRSLQELVGLALPGSLARRSQDDWMRRARSGPVTRPATVMFTDIVHSTELLTELGNADWQALYGAHLALLHECVARERGDVFDETGDGIVAVWGCTARVDDHADAALRAAQLIMAGLRRAVDRGARHADRLRIRVGIHSGDVQVGFIGAQGHGRLGITGRTVNLTQRLEQHGKSLASAGLQATVLVSETTKGALRRSFPLVDIGVHRLRDADADGRIWRLLDPSEAIVADDEDPARPQPVIGAPGCRPELTER